MKQTEQTLLEQMRITDFDIANRKELLSLDEDDFKKLQNFRPIIESKIDALVDKFYQLQTNVAEISLLIGDADTLGRLRTAQRRYVLDLFSGLYDLEYVNNRLRIGLVHKRIGVEPKLYLSAISTLKALLHDVIYTSLTEEAERRATLTALSKLFLFDITLVFETYIRSLVSEIEISREKSESYASILEEKVRDRTCQLEEMSRTDPLTGLLNVRGLTETLTRILRSAQRRAEPVSIVYLDINNFKLINDNKGHQYGDEVLRAVGHAISAIARMEDCCFRYGGDEFCLILPNCFLQQATDTYVHRLNGEISQRLDNITLSAGIVQAGPVSYEEPEALIRIADDRMYQAKKEFKTQHSL
ncbi:diguanylate cyclase [Iodobacter sp. HSC-16F04]|uniref:Diguanylate cyclase DosC n=1 Tax=Iodobacter violaceini TaxID=3044271 RepID=A0ABX0KSA3_9NEIS|nr:diguanylate cyclase [Iodobacter violacea]NHQ87533.1 diguanylate cyclase [Iodobacter violacea]